MSKVAIVIDSTATLSQPLVEQYNIRVLPLTLIFGTETFRDGIDITPDQFYSKLESSPIMPTTSQVQPPSTTLFRSELLEQDYSVLTILISHKLSGTMQSALQAQETLKSDKIEIVDSGSTSMGIGFPALAAARAAADGADLKECKAIAENCLAKIGIFFVVKTLKYLHKGGRIGGGARFLGTAMDLKPILELKDGYVEPIERVRTQHKAFERMLELVDQSIGGRKPVHLAAMHAKAPVEASELLERACQRHQPVESMIAELSPVLGTHAGPGTVGLVYMAG
ncbi:MAG: DegV family protein [Chloroflexi bacterium]|nr:DegV family protein [Chloroflexota bacterium]